MRLFQVQGTTVSGTMVRVRFEAEDADSLRNFLLDESFVITQLQAIPFTRGHYTRHSWLILLWPLLFAGLFGNLYILYQTAPRIATRLKIEAILDDLQHGAHIKGLIHHLTTTPISLAHEREPSAVQVTCEMTFTPAGQQPIAATWTDLLTPQEITDLGQPFTQENSLYPIPATITYHSKKPWIAAPFPISPNVIQDRRTILLSWGIHFSLRVLLEVALLWFNFNLILRFGSFYFHTPAIVEIGKSHSIFSDNLESRGGSDE